MKYIILFLLFPFISLNAQNTEEIKIEYTNGLEIFSILKINPNKKFDNEKDYYWYSEYSKVKSTKGGSGGSLLHGNYKFYDEKGNLIEDKNYSYGLKHGESKEWDEYGDLIEIHKYENGERVYRKYHPTDSQDWIEIIGDKLTKRYNRNNEIIGIAEIFTNPNDSLIREKKRVTVYHDNHTTIKGQYTTYLYSSLLFSGILHIGEYFENYENGNTKVVGKYFDPYKNGIGTYLGNLCEGEWKYYDENGKLSKVETYKVIVEKWKNGKLKNVYSQLYDEGKGEWLIDGPYFTFSENGGDKRENIPYYVKGELKESED